MSFTDYRILPYGANAILIQWKETPSKELFLYLNAVKELLSNHLDCEFVLTYRELLLKSIAPTKQHIEEIERCLHKKIECLNPKRSYRKIRVPVCYDAAFGLDIEDLAKAKSVSVQELIELHTQPEYLIYFLGFLPGFPYLLGLDKQLYTPRKAVPSREVMAGSVAIGGEQTGIYPQNSPGGWHIMGHCPIVLFDANASDKTLFMPGDIITFEAITRQEHKELSNMPLETFKTSLNVSYG